MKELKVALIGFGGIARSHNAGYHKLVDSGYPIKMVAVCDCDPSKFDTETEINLGKTGCAIFEDAKRYTDVDALINEVDFDMADICVPDYMHKDMAVKLLRAGKHVLVEKPMALNSEDCRVMMDTAEACKRRLMVAQCLRFEPFYLYLKEIYDSGKYGALKNIYMNRLSISPTWGFENFYRKTECCGGSIMNLHIHDIDMARFIFGEPKKVSAIAHDGDCKWANVNSRLMYDGFFAVINSSFDEAPGTPFKMDYRARFDGATVIFDGNQITVYTNEGEKIVPELPAADRMAEEIRYIAELIFDEGKVNLINPPESAAASVALIETLRESIARGGEWV